MIFFIVRKKLFLNTEIKNYFKTAFNLDYYIILYKFTA